MTWIVRRLIRRSFRPASTSSVVMMDAVAIVAHAMRSPCALIISVFVSPIATAKPAVTMVAAEVVARAMRRIRV